MVNNAQADRSNIIEAAIQKLSVAEHYFGASLVYMPNLYPSGSSVVLQISGGGRGYVVSDRAGAYYEAEEMGALRSFKQEATKVISEGAISFDGKEFSVSEVSSDALPAVIQAVAHYSQLAANLTAMRVADKAREDAGVALYERLVDIFTPSKVSKNVELVGASHGQWSFDAMLVNDGRRVVFDAVGNSLQSVVWAVTKFGDVSALEQKIGRVAVVESNKAMGNKMGLIAPNVSAVVELRAPDNDYKELEKRAA